jgi:hypothetical protein
MNESFLTHLRCVDGYPPFIDSALSTMKLLRVHHGRKPFSPSYSLHVNTPLSTVSLSMNGFLQLQSRSLSSFQKSIIQSHETSKPNPSSSQRVLNVGKVITVLQQDLNHFFDKDLDYSIYTNDIVFRDVHQRLRIYGKDHYKHWLRLAKRLLRWYFVEPHVKLVSIHTPNHLFTAPSVPSEIHARWMFEGVPRWRTIWHGKVSSDHRSLVRIYEGISIYKLHSESGWINEHILEKIVPPPRIFLPLRTYMKWYFFLSPSVGLNMK